MDTIYLFWFSEAKYDTIFNILQEIQSTRVYQLALP